MDKEGGDEIKQACLMPVFREKLCLAMEGGDVTFARFAELLMFQPQVVAHLLQIANSERGKEREHLKPTNIHGIINQLGTLKVEQIVLGLPDAPPHLHAKLQQLANDSYELAVVFAHMAECRLGRHTAREFFLLGLLNGVVEEDFYGDCHEEIRRRGKLRPAAPSKNGFKGDPSLDEAKALLKNFRNRRGDMGYKEIYAAWEEAKKDIACAFEPVG